MSASIVKKLEQWSKWLSSNDPHDCASVLANMLWDRAVAKTYDEFATSNQLLQSDLLGNFVSQHYFQSQTLRVRRLVDNGKNISSLGRVLSDMRQNRTKITRRAILIRRGIELDPAEAEKEERMFMEKQMPRVPYSRPGNTTLAHKHNTYHELDMLCGPDLNDPLKLEVLSKLESKLETVKEIETFVNKMVAHSVVPENRARLSEQELLISGQKLDKALEELVGVFTFLTSFIDQSGTFLLPIGWEYAARGLSGSEIDVVSNAWHGLSERIKQWQQWGYNFHEEYVNS